MFGLSKRERLRRAAEQGPAESQMWLGYAYQVGEGVQQDYAEALKWYRLAGVQGHAASQCNLGVMYQNGEGVPQDYQETARWFYRSAVQGYAPAQFNLAGLYRSRVIAVVGVWPVPPRVAHPHAPAHGISE
jgi:uncharacterized protein